MQGAELALEKAVTAVMKAWAKWTITLRVILAAAQATKSPAGMLHLDKYAGGHSFECAWQQLRKLSFIDC